MRLNLPKYRCVRFELSSEFTVQANADAGIQSIMDQTETFPHGHVDGDGNETRVAFFGSISKVGGVTHQIRGRLTREHSEHDPIYKILIATSKASDELSPPPRKMRPVSRLIEAGARLFGSIQVKCDIVFVYDRTSGFRSSITFPIPLLLQGEPDGITHIETAQFSLRNKDEVGYRILVVDSEDSQSFSHLVSLESSLELSNKAIRELLDRASAISTKLTTQVQEGGHSGG